jgi:hypothetical protein
MISAATFPATYKGKCFTVLTVMDLTISLPLGSRYTLAKNK